MHLGRLCLQAEWEAEPPYICFQAAAQKRVRVKRVKRVLRFLLSFEIFGKYL